jgi:hypothetical protein
VTARDRLPPGAHGIASGGKIRREAMTTNEQDRIPMQAPDAALEQAFIDAFLRTRGHDTSSVEQLPEDERKRLLEEASVHAAGKLAEVEARAHFVQELHHGANT